MNSDPAFQIAGTPRYVPPLVRARVVFGGFLNQFGWIFLGFGMIFWWLFVMNSDVTSWFLFRGKLQTADGRVTKSEDTNASVGGSEHDRGTPIYANHYEFTEGGVKRKGVSYATGRNLGRGSRATIEFPVGNPDRSRIQGMRRATFNALAALAGIFPLLGLCFVIAGARRGGRAIRLLKYGRPAVGVLVKREPTGGSVNEQTVYKMTFEFDVPGQGTFQTTAKTHETHLLDDDAGEPLLYDPNNPAYAMMLDHLPGSPSIDATGQIRCDSVWGAVRVLVIPTISIVGHGIYVVWRYG